MYSAMNTKKFNTLALGLHQRGSVLTISLLILLVITIIGATALNDSMMEEKMSANFQNSHMAFQAAESSINKTVITIAQNRDLVLAAITAKETASAGTTPVWPTVNPYTMQSSQAGSNTNVHSDTTLNATVRYVGENAFPAAGCSVVLGKETACKAVVVDVEGSGMVNGTNITRRQIQGAQKILPSGGG